MNKTFLAISELIGTIVGAGFLAIPFVMMKSGFAIGLLHLFLIGLFITILMLYLGEISLRTKNNHQLTGFASKYLGKFGKKIMFLAVAFGVYAAVLAYLIAEGESFSYLIFGTAQYSFAISIIFWIILSALTFYGIKALKSGESFGIIIILILVALITILFFDKIDINNLTYINNQNFFAPFGVILFAYLAFNSITEVKLILGDEKRAMKRSIIIAHVISFIIYVLFALVVLGYKGLNTPEIATLALGKPFIILGILTMFTSYLSLSVSLMNNLRFDYKKTKFKAWLWTISIPLILFIALHIINKTSFITILGVGGVISGGLIAILILLMVKRAKAEGDRKPEYSIPYSKTLAWILSLIFIIGATAVIWHVVN